MAEPFREQLARVILMASGDSTWDLSDNDTAALRALIDYAVKLKEVLRALRNESSGFLSLANVSDHGVTNMKCLQRRIDEADVMLAITERR